MNPRRLQALFRAYFRTGQARAPERAYRDAPEEQSLLSYLMGGG